MLDVHLTQASEKPERSHDEQRLDVEKLAVGSGTAPDAVRRLLGRCGPVQRWVLKRLIDEAETHGRPRWIAVTELAAQHAGGRPSRRQVQSMRNACARLARAGLIETSQRWVERHEERRSLTWLRREITTRRRHLCVRLPFDGCERKTDQWGSDADMAGGPRRSHRNVTLVLARWHEAEHVYILSTYLTTGISGALGHLAASGAIDGGLQGLPPRPRLPR